MSKHCRYWELREDYEPRPFETAPGKNCGNCKHYRPDDGCKIYDELK